MLRTVLTLALTVAALCLLITARGATLLGPNRTALAGALAVLLILQTYRLALAWRKKAHGDRLTKIPKRPLGI